MLYLAIESSCDETSLAFLEGELGGGKKLRGGNIVQKLNQFRIISSVVSSQVKTHAEFGGVVPEIGARQHADQIHFLFSKILAEAVGQSQTDLNYQEAIVVDFLSRLQTIFVTTEPGLTSALRVGWEFAKTLSFFLAKKLGIKVEIVPVNHLRGHVASSFFQDGCQVETNPFESVFPHLHLLVSGGNSQIIWLNSWTDWQIVGQTLDDAVGESLDKIGRMLGLPYPGGVWISKIAGQVQANPANLPESMKHDQSLNFSYSGLKTATRLLVQGQQIDGLEFEKKLDTKEIELLLQKPPEKLNPKLKFIKEVCISAQTVTIQQLMRQFQKGVGRFNPVTIGLSGGVSANPLLRQEMGNLLNVYPSLKKFYLPPIALTGDNAVMIGLAGLAERLERTGQR
jgi:N6-L-threonylcarbamoyladenine synthase